MIGLKLALLKSVTYAFMYLQWNISPSDEIWCLDRVSVRMWVPDQKIITTAAEFSYPGDVNCVAILINHPTTIYAVTNHYIYIPDNKPVELTSEPFTYILTGNETHTAPTSSPTPSKLRTNTPAKSKSTSRESRIPTKR